MTFAKSGNSALQDGFLLGTRLWIPVVCLQVMVWCEAQQGRSQQCNACGSLQLQRLLASKNNLSDRSGYLSQTNFIESLGIFFWNNDFLYNLNKYFCHNLQTCNFPEPWNFYFSFYCAFLSPWGLHDTRLSLSFLWVFTYWHQLIDLIFLPVKTKSAMLTFLGRCEQTCPMQCPLSGGEESSHVAEEEGLPCPSGTLTSQAAVGRVETWLSRTALHPPLSFEHLLLTFTTCREQVESMPLPFPSLAFSFLGCLKAD